jgi:hypothetical protein
MGAKYLPTVKDQKAAKRFERTQGGTSKFFRPAVKPAPTPAPKPAKKTAD